MLFAAFHPRSFNELSTPYLILRFLQRFDMNSLFTRPGWFRLWPAGKSIRKPAGFGFATKNYSPNFVSARNDGEQVPRGSRPCVPVVVQNDLTAGPGALIVHPAKLLIHDDLDP